VELASAASPAWEIFNRLTEIQFQEFKQAGLEFLHTQLLFNRGIKTPAAMRSFLEAQYDRIPDPLSLIDMDRAIERIQRAIDAHEHITIYGDFDADGVTSAALLTRVLRTLKHQDAALDYFIPNRLHDTRGVSKEVLEMLKMRGTALIITTDCGSSDIEAVAYAKSIGIDVIITDHHHPPEQLPQAYALINPWRPDCRYGERYLCGVGIAFKLAQALYRVYDQAGKEQELLDLVAIGTISDIAPLLGENHTLVRLGIEQLNRTQNVGLQALIYMANLQPGKISERDISYILGPRINAAGRMKDASIAFKLLTTNSSEEAFAHARELEELNQSRQRQTEELLISVREEVQRYAQDQVVLVSGDNWPEGIIGLVAGKLAEETQRPVFVLSRGPESSRGSARSHNGFNIIEALRAAPADLLERHGGHSSAAGFTIANDRVEELRQHLQNWHKNQNSGASVTPIVAIAGETQIAEADLAGVAIEAEASPSSSTRKIDLMITRPEYLSYNTYAKIRQLAPFGAGNPEPIFKANGLRLTRFWMSGREGRHLKMRLAIKGVQFSGTLMHGASQWQSFEEGSLVNVIFCVEPVWSPPDNESNQEIWLKILHIEPVA